MLLGSDVGTYELFDAFIQFLVLVNIALSFERLRLILASSYWFGFAPNSGGSHVDLVGERQESAPKFIFEEVRPAGASDRAKTSTRTSNDILSKASPSARQITNERQ